MEGQHEENCSAVLARMEENREQTLLDFQSCTGIDDVGESIMHLEAANWNLLDAIQRVMPDESQTLPSEREMDIPVDVVGGVMDANIPIDEFQHFVRPNAEIMPRFRDLNNAHIQDVQEIENPMDAACALNLSSGGDGLNVKHRLNLPMLVNDVQGRDHGAPGSSELLNFEIRYKDGVVPLEVPKSTTVGEMKAALQAEIGIPVCRQDLSGWPRNHITDDTQLSTLQLSSHTRLVLNTLDEQNFPSASGSMLNFNNSHKDNCQLHIIDTTSGREYDLNYLGSKTVLEVKLGCQDITNIPVRFQHWVGWPDAVKNENITLAALNFDSPLELILSRNDSGKSKKQVVVDLTSSESSENEFEDATECFGVDDDLTFQAGSSSNRVLPLIPKDMTDDACAIENFQREFSNRYGPSHPPFYQGTLLEALHASCLKPARERHPLAIYLHHDASVLTNVFCTQLLCSESVISYLTLNFITWAWDLTEESNTNRLQQMLSLHLGMWASTAIRNLQPENLPALIIFSKVRSMSEVLTVIPGNVGLDELMTRLLHAVEIFNSEIGAEIRDEDEREARERVKREQDVAYEASLMADRAKEEARKQEEEKKFQQDMQAQREKEKQELMQKQEEALQRAIQLSLAEQLPPEPAEDSQERISHIRVRLPNGVTLGRRFLASDTLDVLIKYLESEGYPKSNYKVLASWPRRDLTTLNSYSSLEELKLFPKETLTLEER